MGFYQNRSIIEIDPKYFRPSEVDSLKGNANKAKRELKWYPKHDIYSIIEEMISFEYKD